MKEIRDVQHLTMGFYRHADVCNCLLQAEGTAKIRALPARARWKYAMVFEDPNASWARCAA